MQNILNTAIIVAAGSGSRMGESRPKQFLLLKGQEVLSYSVKTFLDHPKINDVIIVTSSDFLSYVKGNYPECTVVLGGASRQDSVAKGLKACPEGTHIVLVHDAARPLLPSHIIDECIKQLDVYDGAAPAIKPVDSMVQIEGEALNNLTRDNLRIVQTPQCFRMKTLQQAHASGLVDTDEMGLVKKAITDAKLTFIEGAPETIKITRATDLKIAEIFLDSTHPET